MTRLDKRPGKFWPEVRRLVYEKAIDLYMAENYQNPYFTGLTPEVEELRGGGYLHRSKLLVLREVQKSH